MFNEIIRKDIPNLGREGRRTLPHARLGRWVGSSIGQPRRAERRQQHVVGRREEEKREIEEEDRGASNRASRQSCWMLET